MLFCWHQFYSFRRSSKQPVLSLSPLPEEQNGGERGEQQEEKHRDVSCGDPECLQPVLSPTAGLIRAVKRTVAQVVQGLLHDVLEELLQPSIITKVALTLSASSLRENSHD